jgi:hypothetical protein
MYAPKEHFIVHFIVHSVVRPNELNPARPGHRPAGFFVTEWPIDDYTDEYG